MRDEPKRPEYLAHHDAIKGRSRELLAVGIEMDGALFRCDDFKIVVYLDAVIDMGSGHEGWTALDGKTRVPLSHENAIRLRDLVRTRYAVVKTAEKKALALLKADEAEPDLADRIYTDGWSV